MTDFSIGSIISYALGKIFKVEKRYERNGLFGWWGKNSG